MKSAISIISAICSARSIPRKSSINGRKVSKNSVIFSPGAARLSCSYSRRPRRAYFPEYIPDKFGCSEQSPRPEYFSGNSRTSAHTCSLCRPEQAGDRCQGQISAAAFQSWAARTGPMLAVTLSAREIAARISAQGKWRLPEVRFFI